MKQGYYQQHKEKIKEYQKKYYQENHEHILEWKKQWYQENKTKWCQYYQKQWEIMHKLKINGCAICGYDKCDRALHFHHVNPKDKKFNVVIRHVSNKNLIDELNKCILLCANCHLEFHGSGIHG